ncbi:MAG: ABC transporter permease subunit [Armatimonadia bacterium]|nr:ABC transporter permease subunit [Armatimonadia bacterium]
MAEATGPARPVWQRVLAHILLVFFSAVFIMPFVWLVSSSVKPDSQIFRTPPEWIPKQPVMVSVGGEEHPVYEGPAGERVGLIERLPQEGEVRVVPAVGGADTMLIPQERFDAYEPVREFGLEWSNYPEGLRFINFGQQLTNTLIVCISSAFGAVLSCSLVAYGLARVPWRGRNGLFYVILATMMIPPQVTMVPLFVVFAKLGMVNTFWPLILPMFFAPGFFVFLLRQFFLGIPQDLTDAARIEGCGEFAIYWRIALPLSKPALATVALFAFLQAWNDYLGPLIYLSDEAKYTLSLGIASFSSQYGSFPGMLMAVSTVMTVPIIILFFFTQRTFIQGITLTGLKG